MSQEKIESRRKERKKEKENNKGSEYIYPKRGGGRRGEIMVEYKEYAEDQNIRYNVYFVIYLYFIDIIIFFSSILLYL
jgi:hypothetical protein